MRLTGLLVLVLLAVLELNAQKIVPGEWEPHAAVWIPFFDQSIGNPHDSLNIRIIRKLAQHVHTVILVEDASLLSQGKSLFAPFDVDTSNIRLVRISPLHNWPRDVGPVFFMEGEDAEMLRNCEFRFTSYRNMPYPGIPDLTRHLDQTDRKIADLLGIKASDSELVLEGGAFEVNGKGTMILVDSLVLQRNSYCSKEQIEKELAEKLGIRSFIWLREGLAQDPYGSRYFGNGIYATGTGGHTDHFVRFANDSTILLYWEQDTLTERDPIRKLNYERMSENLKILENSTDHRGKGFHVIKIPNPGMFYQSKPINRALRAGLPELSGFEGGDTIQTATCASYLNYFITNGLVLLPAYDVGSDAEVRSIFQQLFPEREIYQINPVQYNQLSGGIHCLIFQQPAGALH